jgi:hypothetical protein
MNWFFLFLFFNKERVDFIYFLSERLQKSRKIIKYLTECAIVTGPNLESVSVEKELN